MTEYKITLLAPNETMNICNEKGITNIAFVGYHNSFAKLSDSKLILISWTDVQMKYTITGSTCCVECIEPASTPNKSSPYEKSISVPDGITSFEFRHTFATTFEKLHTVNQEPDHVIVEIGLYIPPSPEKPTISKFVIGLASKVADWLTDYSSD